MYGQPGDCSFRVEQEDGGMLGLRDGKIDELERVQFDLALKRGGESEWFDGAEQGSHQAELTDDKQDVAGMVYGKDVAGSRHHGGSPTVDELER